MMNEAMDAQTRKTTCRTCATFHGIYKPKVCTFRADFYVAGLTGVWVCSGCVGVTESNRRRSAQEAAIGQVS